MVKRTPHCKLAVVKTMVAAGKVRATVSALADDVPIVSFKEL